MGRKHDRRSKGQAPQPAEPFPIDEEPEEPNEAIGEDEVEDEDDELAPRVVIGRFSDLAGFADPALLKKNAERPIWFLIDDDDDLHELFMRFPERPTPRSASEPLLAALRSFAAAESDALQALLGPTDSIGFGYHEGATLDDVVESFEDDGFEVLFAIENGKIVPEEEDDDE